MFRTRLGLIRVVGGSVEIAGNERTAVTEAVVAAVAVCQQSVMFQTVVSVLNRTLTIQSNTHNVAGPNVVPFSRECVRERVSDRVPSASLPSRNELALLLFQSVI